VVTTMTTHIFTGQMALAPASLVYRDESSLMARLPGALADHRHVLIVGDEEVETNKVRGLAPDTANRVAALPDVDVVIVEADGSRRLSFKAPADHEPVIPGDTTIVVSIVGMDVLGRPLTAENVHRLQRIAALTGAAPGDPVTPEMIAGVVAHPAGGAKGAPPGARLIPFLNKAEDAGTLAAARITARMLLESARVDSVLIGAAAGRDPVREVWSRAGAVVLAAGRASRFGSLKQVLPWGDKPLVAHVADQALACPDIGRVAVTIGAEADAVRLALGARAVRTVPVPDWAEGQSRSVKSGLGAIVGDAEATAQGPLGAVLFLLADQPGVTPGLLSALVQRHRETLAPVVAPRYRDRRGNPVLFDRSTFDEFSTLQGDAGARPILQARSDEIAWVDWPTPEVIQDIDTADEYRPPTAGA
jgi:molybdenum cofactor cytidylyltransferase